MGEEYRCTRVTDHTLYRLPAILIASVALDYPRYYAVFTVRRDGEKKEREREKERGGEERKKKKEERRKLDGERVSNKRVSSIFSKCPFRIHWKYTKSSLSREACTRRLPRGTGGCGPLNSESRINGRTEEEAVRVGYKYTANGSLLEPEP